MRRAVFGLALLVVCAWVTVADAGIVRIGPGSFTPQASVITFSEVGLGTHNPVYNLVGVTLGQVTVSFNGYFVGQSPTAAFPVGLAGSPSNPLTLISNNEHQFTFTVDDGANPTRPVLTGDPTVHGPISVEFSTPVAAVGLDGGFFDNIGSTTIEAFDASGASLGRVQNTKTGIEFFGLADSSGDNVISGISFYVTADEPAGFAIDNLTFGGRAEFHHSPEPASLIIWSALGAVIVGLGWRRRAR